MSAQFFFAAGYAPSAWKTREAAEWAAWTPDDAAARLYEFGVLFEEDADDFGREQSGPGPDHLEQCRFALDKQGGRGIELAEAIDRIEAAERRAYARHKVVESIEWLQQYGVFQDTPCGDLLMGGGMSWGDAPSKQYEHITLLLEAGLLTPAVLVPDQHGLGPRPPHKGRDTLLRAIDGQCDALDELVHETCGATGSAINNAGQGAQLDFLLGQGVSFEHICNCLGIDPEEGEED